jgi:hypothetical protein
MNKTCRIGATLATLAAGLGTQVALTPPSQASTVATAGAPGVVGVISSTCDIREAWGVKNLITPAPRIYARNLHAGPGNDAAAVRWRSVAVPVGGGTQYSAGWSGWAVARDNQPGAYVGTQRITGLQLRIGYRLRMEVQWWQGGQKVGASWNAGDQMTYLQGGANWGTTWGDATC